MALGRYAAGIGASRRLPDQPQPDQMDVRQLLAAAISHHQAGRLDEAEAGYCEVLSPSPDQVDGLNLLGVVASQRGQHAEAVQLFSRAIALRQKPAAQLHCNLGIAYRGLRDHRTAIEQFQRALALQPDHAEAHDNLAAILLEKGRPDEAEPHCRQAAALRPHQISTHFALALALQRQERWAEAASSYERVLELSTDYPNVWSNLGLVRLNLADLDGALAALNRAVELDPDHVDAHLNLAVVHQERGAYADALACYRRVTTLDPGHADAHASEALLHLTYGQFDTGWAKYEWRWRTPGNAPRSFAKPLWDGGDLGGRTILLHAEQGLGDTIQFVRYAPMVKARGALAVVLECQPGLGRLLRTAPGIDRVIESENNNGTLFDCQAPLLTLPRLFETTLETIPARVPYLYAEPGLVEAWRKKLPAGLSVGLVWRGNPGHARDRLRSIPAEKIALLCGVPDINWISLQIDARPDELDSLSAVSPIRDVSPFLKDWTDTAALIATLDLVVTVDTAVAHLAGALGKPVWIMLATAGHWSWFTDRNDSPWYPAARLFRQETRGDWEPVLHQVRDALSRLAQPADLPP